MARKKVAPPKKSRAKQQHLPGTDHDRHADIDDKAESFLEVQENRRQLAADAKDLKSEIIRLMREYGVETYRVENHIFEVSSKDVVRLKKQKDPKADDHVDHGPDLD